MAVRIQHQVRLHPSSPEHHLTLIDLSSSTMENDTSHQDLPFPASDLDELFCKGSCHGESPHIEDCLEQGLESGIAVPFSPEVCVTCGSVIENPHIPQFHHSNDETPSHPSKGKKEEESLKRMIKLLGFLSRVASFRHAFQKPLANQVGLGASPSSMHGHGSSHGKTILSVCCPCGTNNDSTKTEPIEHIQRLLSQICETKEEPLRHCDHGDRRSFQTAEALQREVLRLPAPQICRKEPKCGQERLRLPRARLPEHGRVDVCFSFFVALLAQLTLVVLLINLQSPSSENTSRRYQTLLDMSTIFQAGNTKPRMQTNRYDERRRAGQTMVFSVYKSLRKRKATTNTMYKLHFHVLIRFQC